jgi:GNAT superfamily N-acetyltransferase
VKLTTQNMCDPHGMNHRPCLTNGFNVDRACCDADVRDNINTTVRKTPAARPTMLFRCDKRPSGVERNFISPCFGGHIVNISYSKTQKIDGKIIYELFDKVGWIAPTLRKPNRHQKIDGISNHTIYLDSCDDCSILERAFENSASIYIAESDSRIIGFVRVISDFYQRSFIYDLVVDPIYQKSGIGTMLVEMCLKEYSNTQITLGTSTKTMKFYENFGFCKSENYMELATEAY